MMGVVWTMDAAVGCIWSALESCAASVVHAATASMPAVEVKIAAAKLAARDFVNAANL